MVRPISALPNVLDDMARVFPEQSPKAVGKAALSFKRTILARAPSRLRNVGRRGAKLNVIYTTRGAGAGATALVRGVGPWPILDNPTKPHDIPRPRRRKRLSFGPDDVRVRVHHPGTGGKQVFAKAQREGTPEATAAAFDVYRDALVKAFKG